MATEKKATRKTADRRTAGADVERQAERLARSLGESAQHVWLAGIGALGRAQAEGSRLFEALVEEGEQLERQARKAAGGRAGEVIQAVGSGVGEIRGKAGDTWSRWEKAFDERMQHALARFGVPHRHELAELNRRVEELSGELRRQRRAPAPRKAAVRKSPARARKAAAASAPGSGKAAPGAAAEGASDATPGGAPEA